MVKFFRVNDPFRIIALLILALACRASFFLNPIHLTIQELNWMVLGEKLSKGFLLYRDIWDNISPLSAGMYALVHLAFGKSAIAYHIIAFVLSFGHALYFNYIARKNELFNDKSYLPAAVYLILTNLFFDFFTLSPVLMSTTFLLITIDNVFFHIRRQTSDAGIFNIGFFISLASLFYLPSISFILFPIFAFVLFSKTSFRQYLVLLIGFSFPSGITFLIYFFQNSLADFMTNFVFSHLYLAPDDIYNAPVFMVILIGPMIVVILAILSLAGSNRHINYQIICQQLMFFWMLLALAVFTFSEKSAGYQLMPLVPAMAFFTIHYMLAVRKKFYAEIAFWALLANTMYITYDSFYGGLLQHTIINTNETFVKPHQYDQLIKNSKVLVTGHNHSILRYNTLATPYFNWGLAENHFGNLNSYNNVIGIYQNFKKDWPDYIIDDQEIMPAVIERVPILGQKYAQSSFQDLYVRRDLLKK